MVHYNIGDIMNYQIEVIYDGKLRTIAKHLSSNEMIITDAPKDNQGKGQFFSPTDMVATALASCMLTIMGITANNQNINIDGTNAKVKKVMGKNPRKIKEIHLQIKFLHRINEKQKKILERAAHLCPVSKSLSSDIKKNITFKYSDEI
tara:strand:+ start:2166 stop:2609 length:444 start_codon:yes stop_codon:yes gene_type:complete